MKGRNIFLVNNLKAGGTEKQVSQLACNDYVSLLICIQPITEYPYPKEKTVFLLKKAPVNILLKLFYFPLIILKLYKLKLNKNDKLICFLQQSLVIGWLAHKLFGVKLITSIRTNTSSYYRFGKTMKMPKYFFKKILNDSSAIVTNSETIKSDLKKYTHNGNIAVIPNGYHLEEVDHGSRESIGHLADFFANNKVIVNVGRLEYEKAQRGLIKIFSEVVKKNETVKLVIIGKGSLKNQLFETCKNLRLRFGTAETGPTELEKCQVLFLGFQLNPYKFLSRSYLFAFTSLFEGLPNAPVEALLCGTPCVLADCESGPREILLQNEFLKKDVATPLRTSFGYLLPTLRIQSGGTDRLLQKEETIWTDTILQLVNDELEYSDLKNATFGIRSIYNSERISLLWKEVLN